MTLEMPFKDNVQLAGPDGWTPARCEKLGAGALDALLDVLLGFASDGERENERLRRTFSSQTACSSPPVRFVSSRFGYV